MAPCDIKMRTFQEKHTIQKKRLLPSKEMLIEVEKLSLSLFRSIRSSISITVAITNYPRGNE